MIKTIKAILSFPAEMKRLRTRVEIAESRLKDIDNLLTKHLTAHVSFSPYVDCQPVPDATLRHELKEI